MAVMFVKQSVNGVSKTAFIADISTADLALITPLLEGSFEVFKASTTGGSVTTLPAVLNKQTYRVLKSDKTHGKERGARTLFTIPHLKTSKSSDDVVTATKGVFDCRYDSAVKCDVVSLSYANFAS